MAMPSALRRHLDGPGGGREERAGDEVLRHDHVRALATHHHTTQLLTRRLLLGSVFSPQLSSCPCP